MKTKPQWQASCIMCVLVIDSSKNFWSEMKVDFAPSYSILCNPHGLYSPWNSPVKVVEWVAFPFSRGIFPTQGSNPGLPHTRWILYQLSHQRSPRILEQVSYPFSRESSWPRGQTRVSCIAGTFFPEYLLLAKHWIWWLYLHLGMWWTLRQVYLLFSWPL